jgi:hypothetical protein
MRPRKSPIRALVTKTFCITGPRSTIATEHGRSTDSSTHHRSTHLRHAKSAGSLQAVRACVVATRARQRSSRVTVVVCFAPRPANATTKPCGMSRLYALPMREPGLIRLSPLPSLSKTQTYSFCTEMSGRGKNCVHSGVFSKSWRT